MSNQLVRTSHPSGSRLWSDPNKEILSRPWQINLPQKTVGTTPRPRIGDSQIVWLSLLGRPTLNWLTAWAYPLIKSPPSCLFKGRDSGQSSLVVLSQPQYGLTAPSQPYKLNLVLAEGLGHIKSDPIPYDIVTGPAQLVRHRLNGDDPIGLGQLALVEAFDLRIVPYGKIGRLHKRPR